MILVLAGTQDGRAVAERLAKENYPVTASVVSSYGKKLYEADPISVNDRPLDAEELKVLMLEQSVTAVVDASHPYAVNVSKNAMQVCSTLSIPYIRYERKSTELPPYDRFFFVSNYEEAARKTASLGDCVFLTTGSRNLKVFAEEPLLQNHTVIARVLPETEVIAECMRLGFTPKTLIAMQGPFSHTMNIEMYKKYAADVIVTKNSGTVGGTDTKITAAIALGLPVVIIERPQLTYHQIAETEEGVLALLKQYNCK